MATVEGVLGELDPATGGLVRSLTLRDCRLDQVTGGHSAAGHLVTLPVFDRRWR